MDAFPRDATRKVEEKLFPHLSGERSEPILTVSTKDDTRKNKVPTT